MGKYFMKQSGFTLVEMAIGLIILGLLSALGAKAFSGVMRFNAEQKTYENMEIIADAISMYAQKHMRVPCPAALKRDLTRVEPFGVERGAGDVDSNNVFETFGACNSIVDAEGIVPFATLGLPERVARDHFGNLLTYRVSLTSARTPNSRFASGVKVNQWCTTKPRWFADTDPDSGTIDEQHINWAKAAFCCGTWEDMPAPLDGIKGDIEIRGVFNTPLPELSRAEEGYGGDEDEYREFDDNFPPLDGGGSADLLAGTLTVDSTQPPIFPAYIIVSHGLNGLGAYTENGLHSAGAIGPELENADGNDVVFYAPDRLAPTIGGSVNLTKGNNPNDFDDLVYWATPAQILGRLGRVSCARP